MILMTRIFGAACSRLLYQVSVILQLQPLWTAKHVSSLVTNAITSSHVYIWRIPLYFHHRGDWLQALKSNQTVVIDGVDCKTNTAILRNISAGNISLEGWTCKVGSARHTEWHTFDVPWFPRFSYTLLFCPSIF